MTEPRFVIKTETTVKNVEKQPYYLPENDNLYNYTCDQTVLIDKTFIPNISRYSLEEDNPDPPDSEEWYPYVNSYYQYAEDFDAVNRVPHLLHEKWPRVGCKRQTKPNMCFEKDPYTEQKAHQKYLRSKPVSFLLLGKPDLGEDKLGQLLAEQWRCVYIHPESLIKEEIDSDSRAGLCIEFNLRCGRAISIDVIMRLLEKRMKCESVAHRGFVICGFPLIANDLYMDDPVSSETAIFNVNEIFEELLESTFDLLNISEVIKYVSRTSQGESVEDEFEEEASEILQERFVPVKDIGVASREICFESHENIDYTDQMNYIFHQMKKREYIIVYLKCRNDEVVNCRKGLRCDAISLEIFNSQSERNETADIYGLYPEDYGGGNVNRKVLHLQKDIPAHVRAQLQHYLFESEPVIEKFILLHDPEWIIRLDARMDAERMYNVLKTRLRVLPITPNIIPEVLLDPHIDDEPGEGPTEPEINYDELSLPESFEMLCKRKISGPLYKWSLSDWEFKCPYAIFHNNYTDGTPKNAVQFLNKIFYLSSDEAMMHFMRNPRPYLLSPNPRPPCKAFIMGPKCCGKSTVAQCIHYLLNGVIVNGGELETKYSLSKYNEILAVLTEQAEVEAMELIQQKHEEQLEEAENKRSIDLQAFIADIKQNINEYFKNKTILDKTETIEYTSLPAPSSKTVSQHMIDAQQVINDIIDYLKSFKIPVDVRTLKDMLGNDAYIAAYAPKELSERIVIDQTAEDDIFIADYIKQMLSVEETKLQQGELCSEDLTECFMNGIGGVEDTLEGDQSGWIIDGLPLDVEMFEKVKERYMANLIIILRDTSENMEYLCKHQKIHKDVVMEDFAGFFNGIGLTTAAESAAAGQNIYKEPEVVGKWWDKFDYKDYLEKFQKKYEEFIEYFKENEVKYVEISVTHKNVETLMLDVVRFIEGQFSQRAAVLTEEDRQNERADYGDHNEAEEMGGEDDGDQDELENFFIDNRRMGDCGYYDAVAYEDYGILWKGKEEFSAKYINKIYLFANQEHLNMFVSDPLKYRLSVSPKLLPAPRICITGVHQIGKTTQARLLSKRLGLIYICYEENFSEASDESYDHSVLHPLWFNEPYKSIGFVLDGYPHNPKQIDFMCSNMLIPDLILEIACNELDLNNRLLNILMQEWRVQMENNKDLETQQFMMMHSEWEIEHREAFDKLVAEKKDLRYKKIREEENDSNLKSSAVSFRSIDDEDDLREIEIELQELLPEPILDDNWETEEHANERILTAIEDSNAGLYDAISETRIACETELIPWSTIDAKLEMHKIYNVAVREVLPIKYRNTSFFERTYDLSIDLAEKLLQQGFYFLSRFGKTCPVQLYENYNLIQLYLRDESKFLIFPIVHRHCIYFISGVDNRIKFKNNVIQYVNQKNCQMPLFPLRIAVIGPPKSGKSTLAERIEYEYGLKHISIGKALRYVLKYLPQSILGVELESLLRKGKRPNHETCMLCVEAISFDNVSVAAGFVMDGFPNNIEDIKILAQLNLVPHLIIEISAELDYIQEYMDINEAIHKPEFSKKFIWYRYINREMYIDDFRKYLNSEYQNIALLPINPSKWHFWYNANELILAVVSEIKYYYKNKDQDTVLRIANMLVTPMEFNNRASSFKNYCPCCLYHDNCLTVGGNPPDRTNMLQYQSKYYWLCEEHVDEFIYNPRAYLGPNTKHSLPNILPIRLNLTEKPDNCYSDGLCVICIEHNLPKRVTNEGLPQFAVLYGDLIYLFDTENCLLEYMARPHVYCNVVKVGLGGIVYPSMNINDLPTLGLLEQFDAQQLVRAVIHTENLRPLVPGLDIETSALINLGLFLKIMNPNTPKNRIERYKHARDIFMNRHTTLIETMRIMKQTINPYLHFEEPIPDPFAHKTITTTQEVPSLEGRKDAKIKNFAAFQIIVESSDSSNVELIDDRSQSMKVHMLKSQSDSSSSED